MNEDLAEVVRCKNCRYWDDAPFSAAFPEYHRCGFWWIEHVATKPDEFCSHGAKKLEENCE